MFLSNRGIQKAIALVLSVVFSAAGSLAAQDHVVPLTELHRQAVSATQARQVNLAKAEGFFTLEGVQHALRTVKMDSAQVKGAVALLSDQELARLASRTDKVQADLAAGALSNQELTYIVIALATAVLVLIIVKAR